MSDTEEVRSDPVDKSSDLTENMRQLEQKHEIERQRWHDRFSQMEEAMRGLMTQIQQHTQRPSTSQSDEASHGANRPDSSINIPINQSGQDAINVQVEHIVRSERDFISHRLRPFSGNSPKGGEVDFEEWKRQIDLVLDDDSLSDKHKRQKILGSLHTPALDIARSLEETSAENLFKHLEELYGSTTNGPKLLHDFFRTTRGSQERLSDYLQRISVKLSKAAKKGAINEDQVNETLVTHFKSTCANERLTNVLHVKYDQRNPPSFQELMKEVNRIEELNNTQKVESIRPRMGAQARSHVVEEPSLQKLSERMDMFDKDLREWTSAISNSIQQFQRPTPAHNYQQKSQNNAQRQPSGQQFQAKQPNQNLHSPQYGASPLNQRSFNRPVRPTNRSRPAFICYNCGKEGHFARACQNKPNPSLVHQRLNHSSGVSQQAEPRNYPLNGNPPSHQ